jgi:peroxiredoxin
MKQSVLFLILAVGAGCVVFAFFAGCHFLSGTPVDMRVKDFTLPLLSGGTVRLSSYLGQPVLLVFFTPSCGHCHSEAPRLEAVYRKYRDRGLVVLGVGYIGGSTEEALRNFVTENNLTYPVAIDTPETKIVQRYNVSWVPHNVFFNRQGNIVREERRELSPEELEEYLQEIL